jgi:hypothetical protein
VKHGMHVVPYANDEAKGRARTTPAKHNDAARRVRLSVGLGHRSQSTTGTPRADLEKGDRPAQ